MRALALLGSLVLGSTYAFAREVIIPVVVNADGADGSHWATSLELVGKDQFTTYFQVCFWRANRPNGQPDACASGGVSPGALMVYEEVLQNLFGIDDAFGFLTVYGVVKAHAIIHNTGPDGSFVQYVPTLDRRFAIPNPQGDPELDSSADLFSARQGPAVRSNLGIVNPNNSELVVWIAATTGYGYLGHGLEVTVPANSSTQVNNVLKALNVPSGPEETVPITVVRDDRSSGRFFAYLSIVDAADGSAVLVIDQAGSPTAD